MACRAASACICPWSEEEYCRRREPWSARSPSGDAGAAVLEREDARPKSTVASARRKASAAALVALWQVGPGGGLEGGCGCRDGAECATVEREGQDMEDEWDVRCVGKKLLAVGFSREGWGAGALGIGAGGGGGGGGGAGAGGGTGTAVFAKYWW